MLSAVVLPAPFGPIRPVIGAGRHREARVADRAHAAERIASPATCVRARPWPRSRCSAGAAPARSGRGRAHPRAPRQRARPLHQPGDPVRRHPQHHEQQRAEEQQPVILEARQRLRQHPDDDRTNDGPANEPAPPIITTSTNRIDCRNANELGVTNPDSGANRPPANPASAAETAKATVLTAAGRARSTPRRFRCRALRASPRPTCRARASGTATARPPPTTIATTATVRSLPANPESAGRGRCMRPFWPPVSARISIAPCSTMKPNAMVIIARYGPLTRSAGSATT